MNKRTQSEIVAIVVVSIFLLSTLAFLVLLAVQVFILAGTLAGLTVTAVLVALLSFIIMITSEQ